MSTFIEEFYYGNIEPQEVNSELTPKLKKKLGNLAEKEEQLTARLTGEDKELFQNYVSAYIEFSTTSNADSFISGFRLGAKFTYETFVENSNFGSGYRKINPYIRLTSCYKVKCNYQITGGFCYEQKDKN